MMTDVLVASAGRRVLSTPVFESVLDCEMKRARQSQGRLTLVVLSTRHGSNDWTVDGSAVERLAAIVTGQIRETDVVGISRHGLISLALLDAEIPSCAPAIERLVQDIDGCELAKTHRLTLGAACYPTDADDVDSLTRRALDRPVMKWRAGSPDLRIRG